MLEKLKSVFLASGLKIMLAGFTVSAVGIVFYIKMKNGNPLLDHLAFGTTCAGIVIYLAGRIGVTLQRREQRRSRQRRDLDSGDDTT